MQSYYLCINLRISTFSLKNGIAAKITQVARTVNKTDMMVLYFRCNLTLTRFILYNIVSSIIKYKKIRDSIEKNCFNYWGDWSRWSLSCQIITKKIIKSWYKRRSSSFNTGRLENIYEDPHEKIQIFTQVI